MNYLFLRRPRAGSKSQTLQVLLACLLCVAPWLSACAFQQKPKTATAKKVDQPLPGLDRGAIWGAEVVHLVEFPSPEVEFIAGPQLIAGSPLNPVPWYDTNAFDKGLLLGAAFPEVPPSHLLEGTVSIEKGSKVIVGTGTRFRTDLAGAAPYSHHIILQPTNGTLRNYILTEVQDDTHLGVSVAWQHPSASGLKISKASGDEVDQYLNLNYYDQALCHYINYYRTGDQRFLTYARKITDSWWQSSAIAKGKSNIEDSYSPRNSSLAGLMLRALDGRPEMWPWIVEYTRYQFDTWVGSRVTYPSLYFGVRDGGYMLLHATNLARVHPDAAVRQEFRAKVLNAATNWYARVQFPDGSWRWGEDGAWIGDAMQPFHVGLLLEGMIAVHRLTGDERVKNSIVKGAEAVFKTGYNSRSWRGTYYQVGGKWADGTNCEKGCGTAASSFPPADKSQIAEARQLNVTSIHALGYAYLLTKDQKFRQWGDEMFDAAYSGADGYRALANFRAKEYDEAYRSGGRYLAWRLAWNGASAPTPLKAVATTTPAKAEAAQVAAGNSGSVQDNVTKALQEAMRLSAGGSISESDLQTLLDNVTQTYTTVADQVERFLYPTELLDELSAARDHTRAALLIVKSSQGSVEDSKLRVGWAAARLKRAGERMQMKVK